MRTFTPLALLAAAVAAGAEEPVELKWKLAEGDRFSLNVACEYTQERNVTEAKLDTRRNFTLNATIEVVKAGDGEADLEIRIQRTDGKERIADDGEVENRDLGTEASNWKQPLKATLGKRGTLEFDPNDLMRALGENEVPLLEALNALFPVLPEAAAKPKDSWPGANDLVAETWQLAAVKRSASAATASLAGTAKSEGTEKLEDGKEAKRTLKGTMTAEFDLNAGHITAVQSRLAMEVRLPSKGKPREAVTAVRTATLKKLPPAKK